MNPLMTLRFIPLWKVLIIFTHFISLHLAILTVYLPFKSRILSFLH